MRSFILEKNNKRFKGDKVSDIAKKAAKYLFQTQKNNNKSITFCIRETTKDSKNKSYKYKAVLNENSKINIKKYIGGYPNDYDNKYNIGHIVSLYDEHEKAYITYNDSISIDTPLQRIKNNQKYFLHYKSVNGIGTPSDMVYYSDNLKLETDIRRISYWKIIAKRIIQNIIEPYYVYVFKLEDKKLEDKKLEDKKLEDKKLEDKKLEDKELYLAVKMYTSDHNKNVYFCLSNKNENDHRIVQFKIKKNDNNLDNDILDCIDFNNHIEHRDKMLITVRHKIPSVEELKSRETGQKTVRKIPSVEELKSRETRQKRKLNSTNNSSKKF